MSSTSQIPASKLKACVPYNCPRGNFLQLPHVLDFSITLNNVGNSTFLDVPGQEVNAPPQYHFLVHAISALVDLPYTYLRIKWPDGKFFSNVPVDIWSMMQTGRNGRVLEVPKFLEKNSIIQQEFGTQQTGSPVNVQVFYEGALLIPA